MPREYFSAAATASPEHRRWFRAIELLIRQQIEGKPLEQCWAEVHPDSTLDPEAARMRAVEELDWRRRNYPLTMTELLPLYDLGTLELIDDLKKQLSATRKLPTKVIREGGRVVSMETLEVADNLAQDSAFDQWVEISRYPEPII